MALSLLGVWLLWGGPAGALHAPLSCLQMHLFDLGIRRAENNSEVPGPGSRKKLRKPNELGNVRAPEPMRGWLWARICDCLHSGPWTPAEITGKIAKPQPFLRVELRSVLSPSDTRTTTSRGSELRPWFGHTAGPAQSVRIG